MLFIQDCLQSSDEVAPFIKLLDILKFYYLCLENLKAPVVSVYAIRKKGNLLKLYPNVETASRNKKVFNSFKDGLVAALEYFREH